MQYIKMLSELNRDDLPIAGGKGANLGAMINAGLPVPAGFCVTTAAYRRFVEHNQLQDRILQMAAQAQPDRMDQLETVSDHIRQLFETGQMPEDITAEIRTAYLQASQAEGEDAFAAAVRSSATAEDLPDFSFAGQQDTYLNITGEQALIQAVVRCWGSLWTARAIGYRARNGIAQDEVSLAVVVQQMVLSEASGVLFTANPLTGKRSETVVDATLGLGEALVAGMVEPDQYLIDTRAGKILKKTLGAKALSIRAVEGGGTNTVHEDAALQQALPDEQILALAELGQRAARYFGSPQDMEWAWSGGRLYVLQSRPITSLYPLPEGLPEEPLKILFSVAGWQGMLDPISPLGRDTLMNLIIGIFNHVGAGLNPYDQQILLSAGERLFPNLTGMFRSSLGRKILGVVLPAVDPASLDIVQALMEDPRLSVEPKGIRLSTYWRLLRIFLPVAGHVTLNFQNPSREREILNRKIAAILQQAEEDMQQADDLIPMVDLVEEKLRSLPRFLIPYLVPSVASGQAAMQILLRISKGIPDGRELVLGLTRGLPYNVTTEMDLTLWSTAQAIRADAESLAYFQAQEATTLSRDYLAGRLPAAAHAAVQQFIKIYGARTLGEIDIYRRRWREDPTHILQVLKGYLTFGDDDPSPEFVFQSGIQKSQEASSQLISCLRRMQFGWIKARLAKFLIHRLRELGGLRETPKFTFIRMFGILRMGLLRVSKKLVEQRVLEQPEDIFFLHLPELRALAKGDLAANPRTLVAHRRQVYQREQLRKRLPNILLSDGTTLYAGASVQSDGEEGTLTGSPVSAGVVEGVVHVVHDPLGTQLAPGEILVCPGTDPAWTPLFLTAGGLITEVGGILTHGSVVAREYGIPAVVGVSQATTRLKTGQRVRVDGSTGRIQVIEDVPESKVKENLEHTS